MYAGDLLGRLDSGSPIAARRVYLVLHHVLKELSSKRLVSDQRNFAQASLTCCAVVHEF